MIGQRSVPAIGRDTHRRVTTLASGDNAVLRISTTCTSRGQVELITQYTSATVGSGTVVNEVKYTYDTAGCDNITKIEQDPQLGGGRRGRRLRRTLLEARAPPAHSGGLRPLGE